MKRVHEGKKFSGFSKQDKQITKCKDLEINLTGIDEVNNDHGEDREEFGKRNGLYYSIALAHISS